jgi:hypothetical protein
VRCRLDSKEAGEQLSAFRHARQKTTHAHEESFAAANGAAEGRHLTEGAKIEFAVWSAVNISSAAARLS